jgi:hypothetical protein
MHEKWLLKLLSGAESRAWLLTSTAATPVTAGHEISRQRIPREMTEHALLRLRRAKQERWLEKGT